MDAFTKDFMSDIASGVTTRFLDRQSVPQARWEPCENIMNSCPLAYDPANPGAKILVGALDGRLIGIDDNRHVMTIAGSRTGKSVTLVNNLLFYRGSILVLDPKGELAAITTERRAALGQRVCGLDPFHMVPERLKPYRTSFNPLSLLSPESDTIIEDAGLISDALVIAGGKDPHWDDSAQNWIEGLLLHIATDPAFEGRRNLVTLRALLRTVFVTAGEGEDDPFALELAMLKTATQGMTVYLCLPANRMARCSRWLRVFINLLLDAMEREKAKPAVPVLACLDEFPVLGHMKQLEDAAGQIASFGVKLWVVLQDWGQGKALKERWETFVGNAGILQFFGNNDLMTTEYISKRLGKTVVKVTREGEAATDQRATGITGRSESLEQYDLLTPDEVSRQFARSDRLKRQLVVWAGYNPLMLQRVEYFDESSPVHPVFAGKYASP